MHRRFTLPAAVVACGTALALAIPAAAGASTVTHHPGASITSSSVMNTSTKRHPFRVSPGKIFEVTARLSGVRKHDRLALESHFRAHRHHPKKWHILGSWKLHRGEHHFVGLTRGSYPGLFTLRVQFLRHHRKLRGSQSNRFYVKVRRFHIHKLRKPHRHRDLLNALNAPNTNTPVSSWNSVTCADPITEGDDVDVTAPVLTLGNTIPLNVWQVAFARDALPGGNYGSWYEASSLPQTLQPTGSDPGRDVFSLGAGEHSYTPDELGEVPSLAYGSEAEFHQIGWDIELQEADGSWVWGSATILTPNSYVQYDRNGNRSQSSTCETFG